MSTAVAKLREVSSRLLANRPLDDATSRWLGDALDHFLKRDCRSLDEAFGLRFSRGGVPWWLDDAMRTRDKALRGLAERFYSNERIGAQASRIRTLAVRYAATAWRWDRERSEAPQGYPGTPRRAGSGTRSITFSRETADRWTRRWACDFPAVACPGGSTMR